jgi:xanthine dehydrogenase molybdopterin-binding subunit B
VECALPVHDVSVAPGVVDVEAALAASPRVLRGAKYALPSQGHMYMEPQTAVAVRCCDHGVSVRAMYV